MAFVPNYNPLDDETETTGSTTGQNQNTQSIIQPIANADSNDANRVLSQGVDTPNTFASSVAEPANITPDANTTKTSGFANLSKYLSANTPGGQNLGNQVAGNINDQLNQATSDANATTAFAAANPTNDIFNTQQNQTAQKDFTTASNTAQLASNPAGQSQLLKNISPSDTTTGSNNLNQFLMGQSGGGQTVANAASQVAPAFAAYNTAASNLENAGINNAVYGNQNPVSQNPNTLTQYGSTSQVPNSNSSGPQPRMMSALSPAQLSYLQSQQQNFVSNPGNAANASIQNTLNQNAVNNAIAAAAKGAGAAGGVSAKPTTGITVTPGNINGSHLTPGSHTGSGSGTDSSGGWSPGFSVGPDGMATPNGLGLSDGALGAIGGVLSKITGIPMLSLALTQLNAYAMAQNQAAADAYNANNVGVTTGGAMDVAGEPAAAGEAQAAANAAATNAQAQSDSQAAAAADSARAAAAAAAEGANSSDVGGGAPAGGTPSAGDNNGMGASGENSGTGANSSTGARGSDGGTGGEGGGGEGGGHEKDGGPVTGPGGPRDDLVPKWLSNGEYVMKASVVKALGKEFFDRLNNSVK